jgi:hypothetical protein
MTEAVAVRGEAREVALALTHVVEARPLPVVPGVEWFEQRSELLTRFRGRDVLLHASIVLPKDYDPKRRYPAIYDVPDFGGNHLDAEEEVDDELTRHCFRIVLAPEGAIPSEMLAHLRKAGHAPAGN